MYANGRGVPKDLVVGYMWTSLAAANGIESARKNLDIVEKLMTREQVAEAQRLAREYRDSRQPK